MQAGCNARGTGNSKSNYFGPMADASTGSFYKKHFDSSKL